MPWKEPNRMDLRYELLRRLSGGERVTDLAREYGISRKTVYKFKARLEARGIAGLHDQARRPKRLARKLSDEVERAVLATKAQQSTWGARKIRDLMPRLHPGVHVPAASTVHAMLLRNGCVKPRRRRERVAGGSGALTPPQRSNHVWATDFKGQFRLGDKSYCYPLTTSDLFSRYLLQCEALSNTREEPAIEAFCELFREHGLPEVIRSDNGVPFASTGNWGLSRLSVLWMRLGIRVERIEPGAPQQNGCHERMHRTLKQDATRPAGVHLLAQQDKLDVFRRTFNDQRPHEALDMAVPADVYRPSPRPCPRVLPEPQYPFADDVLRVHSDGRLLLRKGHRVHLAGPLAHQLVGVQEQPDGLWLVAFASYDLGTYDPSQQKFLPFDRLRPSSLGASMV